MKKENISYKKAEIIEASINRFKSSAVFIDFIKMIKNINGRKRSIR